MECYNLEILIFQVKPGFDFLTFVRSNKNAANGELDGNPGGGKRNMLGFVKVISRDEVSSQSQRGFQNVLGGE